MRTLLLISFTIAILIGLPRLADRFREGPVAQDQRPPELTNAGLPNPDAETIPPAPVRPGLMDAANAAPLMVHTIPAAAPRASVAPAQPAGEADLTTAIEQELVRTGYYKGPPVKTWVRPLRSAARRFSQNGGNNVDYREPSLKLLNALRQAPAADTQPVKHTSYRADEQGRPGAGAPGEDKAMHRPHRKEKMRAIKHRRHRSVRYRTRRAERDWQDARGFHDYRSF